jgi:DNA-binding SARP family transcriptional activator
MQVSAVEVYPLPLLNRGSPETIQVCLLGPFRLMTNGQPLDLLITGKAMTLLVELALRLDSGVPRDELLATLWPDQEMAHATVSLNSLVYSLQRRLRDRVHCETALTYANGSYHFNQTAGVTTDVSIFDAQVARGTRLAAAGETAAARRSFKLAVDLYRGDLCTSANVYAVIERERLRASFLTALAWLADRAYRDGNDAAALRYALRILGCEPCREDAHRIVMRVRVHQGERAQALRQYQICEEVLRREFDTVPEEATRELFERIRSGASLA